MENLIAFEESDPEFGAAIRRIVNGQSKIRGLQSSVHGRIFTMQDGSFRVKKTEENARCKCGSGRKYKKCCGK